MNILIIAIYLVGCLLAHGRVSASFYEIQLHYYPDLDIQPKMRGLAGVVISLSTLLSWIGFLAGLWVYYSDGEKIFFTIKWDRNPKIKS